MKKMICLLVLAAMIASPALVFAKECGPNYGSTSVESDISDTRAELEELQVNQQRKVDEAKGKKGPSDTQEMVDIMNAESTYDN